MCGVEVAVASTKGFLTQLVACYLVGLFLAQVRGIKYEDEVAAIVADLRRLPEAVAQVLSGMEPVRELARSLADLGHRMALFAAPVRIPTWDAPGSPRGI